VRITPNRRPGAKESHGKIARIGLSVITGARWKTFHDGAFLSSERLDPFEVWTR
jgi:hypothetical protein